jgi:hypothetical protein
LTAPAAEMTKAAMRRVFIGIFHREAALGGVRTCMAAVRSC